MTCANTDRPGCMGPVVTGQRYCRRCMGEIAAKRAAAFPRRVNPPCWSCGAAFGHVIGCKADPANVIPITRVRGDDGKSRLVPVLTVTVPCGAIPVRELTPADIGAIVDANTTRPPVTKNIRVGGAMVTIEFEIRDHGVRWRTGEAPWSKWFATTSRAIGAATTTLRNKQRKVAAGLGPTCSAAILMAAASLGHGRELTKEEIAIAAWQMFPTRFGLEGYREKYPNSGTVFAKLATTGKLYGGEFLVKLNGGQWMVTARGHDAVRRGYL